MLDISFVDVKGNIFSKLTDETEIDIIEPCYIDMWYLSICKKQRKAFHVTFGKSQMKSDNASEINKSADDSSNRRPIKPKQVGKISEIFSIQPQSGGSNNGNTSYQYSLSFGMVNHANSEARFFRNQFYNNNESAVRIKFLVCLIKEMINI